MPFFRVIVASSFDAPVNPTVQVVAAVTPEKAGSEALGIELVRSGAKADLAAKVYWDAPAGNATNMVRLYKKVGTTPRPK